MSQNGKSARRMPMSRAGDGRKGRGMPVGRLTMLLMAAAVLLPSLYGFGTKFLEFIALYRGDVEGAFAITPILNYLFASLGFLCLFVWAMFHGMFRDIERPKRQMLETELMLDRLEAAGRGRPATLAEIANADPQVDFCDKRWRRGTLAD